MFALHHLNTNVTTGHMLCRYLLVFKPSHLASEQMNVCFNTSDWTSRHLAAYQPPTHSPFMWDEKRIQVRRGWFSHKNFISFHITFFFLPLRPISFLIFWQATFPHLHMKWKLQFYSLLKENVWTQSQTNNVGSSVVFICAGKGV